MQFRAISTSKEFSSSVHLKFGDTDLFFYFQSHGVTSITGCNSAMSFPARFSAGP